MQEAMALAEAQRAEAIALAKRRQAEKQQQERQEALRAQLERDRLNRLETERTALAHMHHAKSLLFYGCSTAPPLVCRVLRPGAQLERSRLQPR